MLILYARLPRFWPWQLLCNKTNCYELSLHVTWRCLYWRMMNEHSENETVRQTDTTLNSMGVKSNRPYHQNLVALAHICTVLVGDAL